MEIEIPVAGVGRANGVDIGLLYRVGERGRIGLFLKNLNSPKIKDPLPRRVVGGFVIKPEKRVLVGVDFESSINPSSSSRSWMMGFEFEFAKGFFIRCGLQEDPRRHTFGVGIEKGWGRFDWGYLSHEALGGTHGATIILRFGKR
jgi:hypothetical protein